METVIRYVKPNGTSGYFRTRKVGRSLALLVDSLEKRGNDVTSIKLPLKPEMTGTIMLEYLVKCKNPRGGR